MAVDPSIALQVKPIQFESPVNALGPILQAQAAMRQNQLGQIQLQQGQADMADRTGIRNALSALGGAATDEQRISALKNTGSPLGFTQADALEKALQERQKTKAQTGLQNAQVSEAEYKMLKQATGVIGASPTPQTVESVLSDYEQRTGKPQPETRKMFANAGNDPAKIKALADAFAIDADKQMSDQTQRRGQDMTQRTALTTNAATNDTHLKTANIAASTSRQNNAATILKDYNVAGMNPDGSLKAMGVGGAIDLTKVAPEDLAAANRYKTDGTLPPNMGRGAQGAMESRKIRAIASALDAQSGESPEDARVRQLATKGDINAINQMRKREVAVGANVKNFDFNADQALQLSSQVDRSGVPVVNAWINAGRRSVTGNPQLAAFDVAVKTTVNEFAQIVSGTTNGATTEGEKKKAEALLNAQQTPEQIISVINQMKVESRNRMASFAAQRAEAMPTNGSKSAAPAPKAASNGWTYVGPAK